LAGLAMTAGNAGLARAEAPEIEDVEASLVRDQSYKVRVGSALILGRLGQTRSIPALMTALGDPHPAVRASAARALGQIGSPIARDAVAAALRDPAPVVRNMARQALRRLGRPEDLPPGAPGDPGIRARSRPPRLSFEIKAMGDPDRQAGPVMRSHMRDFLIDRLRPFGDVASGQQQGTYAVDGVIKRLSTSTSGRDVEVSCAVQLVVSRQPGGGVFLTTTGEATVQKPKRQWRSQLRTSMELEALEAAVRGASEDLVTHLRAQ
jgi:hypothetical protein